MPGRPPVSALPMAEALMGRNKVDVQACHFQTSSMRANKYCWFRGCSLRFYSFYFQRVKAFSKNRSTTLF